jgi:16S rRNA (cytidine1402-2'-O)-methyltransferase
MTGTLYLCATPIGNLEDITFRVLRTLKEVDLIAAEDTRNSIKLLNHFEIKTPMTSYHEFNKIDKAYQLVAKLKEGKNIALITDAGTPGISDPGEDIVRICYEEGVPVTSLPGAAACITALTMSGRPTRRFAFEAFLPRDKKERARVIEELKNETRTIIIYEAPHHLIKTVTELYNALGDRELTVCRELTKKHEEKVQTTFSELLERSRTQEPRGEYVLVICGRNVAEIAKEQQESWEAMRRVRTAVLSSSICRASSSATCRIFRVWPTRLGSTYSTARTRASIRWCWRSWAFWACRRKRVISLKMATTLPGRGASLAASCSCLSRKT